MFKLLRLELSRVRFYLPSILAFLMMVAMFMLIVQQISQQDQKVWGYLPWIALVANRWYHAYMLPGWLRLVGKHEDYYALLTKSYVMMSLVLNMPLAFILSSNTSWVSPVTCRFKSTNSPLHLAAMAFFATFLSCAFKRSNTVSCTILSLYLKDRRREWDRTTDHHHVKVVLYH